MKLGKNVKKAGALIVVTSIILVSMFAVYSLGFFDKSVQIVKAVEPPEPEVEFPVDHLFIDASFLLKTGETNESVNVSCELFMTNIWEKESGEIKATAYVSEKNSNLANYKSSVEFGIIAANSTKELNIPVKFADSSYEVVILIFESNKLVKKVTLSITSYQNYYYNASGSMIINEGRTLEHIKADGQWSVDSATTGITNIN